jgi:hypothetical protein
MDCCKLFAGTFFLCALIFVGCGGAKSTVSGRVTLDSKPLTTGDVAFYAGEGTALAIGHIDSSGYYQLQTGTEKGLQPGTYQVTVVASEVIEPTTPFASPTPRLLTPPKYGNVETSGLIVEVKPGANRFDIDLRSE